MSAAVSNASMGDQPNLFREGPTRFASQLLSTLPPDFVVRHQLATKSPQHILLTTAVITTFILWLAQYFWAKLFSNDRVELHYGPRSVGIRRGRRPSTSDGAQIPGESRVERISLLNLVRTSCPTLYSSQNRTNVFKPIWFLFNGHLQTCYASLYADYAGNKVAYTRELIYFADGGNVALDSHDATLTEQQKSDPETPIVVVLHGLTGGSHESYVQDVVHEVGGRGYRSVVCNFRGCADTELTSAQLYCGAYTDDARLAVEHIRRKYPRAPLFAVGFSLGANVLTKLVGELGDKCPFLGAVSVSNPFDLLGSSRALHRTWLGRNLYSKALTQNLIRVFKKHSSKLSGTDIFDAGKLLKARYLYEFDNLLTRVMFKYRTVHEYYRKASSAQYIPDIRVPFLVLTALDDPISPPEVLPYFEVYENPHCIMATTKRGGHIGWFEGWFRTSRWHQRPIGEFIGAIVESYRSLPPSERMTLPSNELKSSPKPPRKPTLSKIQLPVTNQQPSESAPQSTTLTHRPKPVDSTVTPGPPRSVAAAASVGQGRLTADRGSLLYMMRMMPRNRVVVLILGAILGFLGRARR